MDLVGLKNVIQENPERLTRWRDALKEAANIYGFSSDAIRPDDGLVEDILEKLPDISPEYELVEQVEMHDRVSESESHGWDSEIESYDLRSKYESMAEPFGQIGGGGGCQYPMSDGASESELYDWDFESRPYDLRSKYEPQGLRFESELQGLRWFESGPHDLWSKSESHDLWSKYESQGRRFLSVFLLVMEAISVVLDEYGKRKKNFLLAAFVLSAFGFIITVYAFIRKRSTPAYRHRPERELAWVDFPACLCPCCCVCFQGANFA